MRKDYLKELDRALKEYNVENRKEVFKKYVKRYEFGLESGLSEEAIEAKLGDPIEIAKKLADVIDLAQEEKKVFDVKINLSSEDLNIVPSLDRGIHAELKDLEPNDYLIEKDEYHLNIKRSKSNYFGTQINGTVNVEIPNKLTISSYEIGTISTVIQAKELNAQDMFFHTNSGDIEIDSINCDELKINTVSGDIKSNTIKAKIVRIETVSGDAVIDSLIADELIVSSISGNVTINSAYVGKVTSNSVSGDILINGEQTGLNVKNSIKKAFGKVKKVFKNEK